MLVYKPLCYRCWPEAQQRRRVGLRNANNGESEGDNWNTTLD